MRAPDLRQAFFAAIAPLLAFGCSAAAPETTRNLSERTAAVLVRAPTVYAPAAPGGVETRETEHVRTTFETALTPEARSRLRHDPTLDLVAQAVAENFSDQSKTESRPLLQWLFWRSGSLATYHERWGGWSAKAHSTRNSGGRQDLASLEDWAVQAAKSVNATPTTYLSYGVARFTEGRVTTESIVLGWDYFEAKSFSKTYAPGGPLTLALKPRTPFKELHFLLDKGDVVEDQTLPARADGSFFLSEAVPTKPGRYFIEIQGPAPRRATLLTVPIYVGVPEPTAPDPLIQNPPPGPSDPAEWPTWLVSTYNAERAKLGKPPIEVDARLGALAARQSLALAGGVLVPLTSPDLTTELGAMGLKPSDLRETVTTVQTVDSILLSLLRPSLRQRFIASDRVLFGAGSSPRPRVGNEAPRFTLVEETVLPAPSAPAGGGAM